MQRTSFSGWQSLCAALCTSGDLRSAYDKIVTLYGTPSRAYHNLTHVDHCLTEFDSARHLVQEPVAVEVALWFHDCIYNSRASDNEEKSAVIAIEVLATLGVHATLCGTIRELILHTRHVAVPDTGDGMIVVDADLAILGAPVDAFSRYEAGVRAEYDWVPDDVFWPKRANFLKTMLGRKRIYTTDFFGLKYESAARENLRRSIADIQGREQRP